MKEEVLKLREEGKTYPEIQQALGCSKGTISYYCGVGQKDKVLKRGKERRLRNKEWIKSVKSGLKCLNCNEPRWWLLDFHHRNPNEKERSVSELITRTSRSKVLEEIEKCEVLCANCHRDFHFKQNNEM